MDVPADNATPAEETVQPATKVRKTYGRKKEVPVDGTSPPGAPEIGFSSRVESLAEHPEGPTDNSSTSRRSYGAVEDASEFSFGWKKKMADIDRMFDDEEAVTSTSKAGSKSSEGVPRKSSSTSSVSTDDSLGRFDDSLLSGSLPPLTSSQTEPSSPPVNARKPKKSIVLDNDVSDAELISKDKESSSVRFVHPRARSKSSTTPILSDQEDEDDLRPLARNALLRDDSEEPQDLEQSIPQRKRKSGSGKRQDTTKKLKKLNRKEEKESKKAHARIMNEQHVSVTKKSEQLTLNDLLGKIQQSNERQSKQLIHATNATSSDPIQDFTSSPLFQPTAASPTEIDRKPGPSTIPDNFDERPNIQDTFQEQEEKKHKREVQVQRKQSLALAKQRILAAKAKAVSKSFDSDDDDLEVVNEEHKPRRSGKTFDYEKKLAGVAGFRVKGDRHTLPENLEGSQGERLLKAAAKPVFVDRHSRQARSVVDHRTLQAAMLQKASKQSIQLTKEKEEEWLRRGGKLPGKRRAAQAGETFSLEMLAEKLSRKKSEGAEGAAPENSEQADSGEDSDIDWKPGSIERGSASPSEAGLSDDEEELCGTEIHEENQALPDDSEEENDEDAQNAPRRTSHLAKRLVVSDSEEDEDRKFALPRILVPDTSMIIDINDPLLDGYNQEQTMIHRGPASSVSGSIPDEDNKENDKRLMFDHSEDKENVSVPRHMPVAGSSHGFGTRQPSGLFGHEGLARSSMSPISEKGEGDSKRDRMPLQSRKYTELDDPFILRSPTALTNHNTPNTSPKASRTQSKSVSPRALVPAFGASMSGFSQLFNDGDGVLPYTQSLAQKAVLQPAFQIRSMSNDLSLQPSLEPNPMELGGFSRMCSPESESRVKDGFKRPENVEDLSLTLDTRLQPVVELSTQVRRKADAVFEKEQVFVLEEAALSKHQERRKPELYVTENGMLTQTKPDGSTPIVYRAWSPSQAPAALASQVNGPPSISQRMPLRTLSLTSDTLSPSQPHRLSRLVKGKGRARSPSDSDDVEENAASSPRVKNAFAELLKGAQRQKAKKLLQKSEFVEGEALESDEDETFGFGAPKMEDDEESDDDNPDTNVEGLLDDNAIDAEQLAEDKVLEKVQEQLDQDDAALQKYHQDAVDGRFRTKRRSNGIVLDDSDSDPDEDEDARRIRQRMYKKRKVEGDQLDALGNDPKSRAYLEAYERDVQEDDNEDFAHLAKDDMDDEEDEENQQPETVSTSEIQAQLRDAARQKLEKSSRPFDPNDVQWTAPMDLSDDEDIGVKEIEMRTYKSSSRRVGATLDDFNDMLPKESSNWNSEQLAMWKREQSGRNLGTGGMRGAVTVTGHGLKRERSGSTSRNPKFASGEKVERRRVPKTGSMLMKVSDKQSRFG